MLNVISILREDKSKSSFLLIAASEPFAVSQETTNILNRSNTATERDSLDEPPSK